MSRRIRTRITYANVMATVAVFIALGGSATAAVVLSKNSVLSKHIKDGQVTTKDVKDASLAKGDFKAGELFTQSQADDRYLAKGAKAADAETVDGQSSEQLLKGGGRVWRLVDESLDLGEKASLGSVDTGFVDFECGTGTSATPDYVYLYNYWDAYKGVYDTAGGSPQYFSENAPGNPSPRALLPIPMDKAADQATIQANMRGGPVTITVSSHNSTSTDGCVVYMQMISR